MGGKALVHDGRGVPIREDERARPRVSAPRHPATFLHRRCQACRKPVAGGMAPETASEFALVARRASLRGAARGLSKLLDQDAALQVTLAARYVRIFKALHHNTITLLAATVDGDGRSQESGGGETPQHEIERMLLGWRFDPCLRAIYERVYAAGAVDATLAEPFAVSLLRHYHHTAKPANQPCFSVPPGLSEATREALAPCKTPPPCVRVAPNDSLPSALRTRVERVATLARESFAPRDVLRPGLRSYGIVPRWSLGLRTRVTELAASGAAGAAYDALVRQWGGLVAERQLAAALLFVPVEKEPAFHAVWRSLVDEFTVAPLSKAEMPRDPHDAARVRLDVLALLSTQFAGDATVIAAFARLLRRSFPCLAPAADREVERALASRAMRWGRLARWAMLVPAPPPSDAVVESCYGADGLAVEAVHLVMGPVAFGSDPIFSVASARSAWIQQQRPFVAPGYLWTSDMHPAAVAAVAHDGGALETATICSVVWLFADGRRFRVEMGIARPVMAAIRQQRLYVLADGPSAEWQQEFLPRDDAGKLRPLTRVLSAVTLKTLEKRVWATPPLERRFASVPELNQFVHAAHYSEPLPDLAAATDDVELRRFVRLLAMRVILLRADAQPKQRTLQQLHALAPNDDVTVSVLHLEDVGDNPALLALSRVAARDALEYHADGRLTVALAWGGEFTLPRQHLSSGHVTLDDIRLHVRAL